MTKSNNKLPRPYNRYNLYFILEREYIIQVRGGSSSSRSRFSTTGPMDIATELSRRAYQDLVLPPLPTKYRILDIPYDWFMPKPKNRKRSHDRTHGVASFTDLSKSVGANWKKVDDETLQFVTSVEKMLKQRHREIVAMEPEELRRSSLPDLVIGCERRKANYNTPPRQLLPRYPPRISLAPNDSTEGDSYSKESVHFNDQVVRDRHNSQRLSLPDLSRNEDEVPQFFCLQCTPPPSISSIDPKYNWSAPDELVMQDFGELEPLLII